LIFAQGMGDVNYYTKRSIEMLELMRIVFYEVAKTYLPIENFLFLKTDDFSARNRREFVSLFLVAITWQPDTRVKNRMQIFLKTFL